MLSPVPDEAFVRQAKNEHLACWWGGLVGGSTMAGKGQEKREPAALGQRISAPIAATGSWRDQKKDDMVPYPARVADV